MVKMFLILNEWVEKATGEAKSCYFFTATPKKKLSLPNGQVGTWSPVASQGAKDVQPIWCWEMTEEMYDIYVEEGYDELMMNVKTGEVTYCGANYKAEPANEATQLNA